MPGLSGSEDLPECTSSFRQDLAQSTWPTVARLHRLCLGKMLQKYVHVYESVCMTESDKRR